MQRKNYKAYFTVEAAVLYPIVLGVIVLMTYLLFFQYDRCLLEQDMGRAAVRSGSRWMQKKEELNRQLQEKDMFFDTEKYIAWESELPVWKLEKNQVTVEQTGRMPYPFSEITEVPRYWSAKAAFQVKRNNRWRFCETVRGIVGRRKKQQRVITRKIQVVRYSEKGWKNSC